VLAVDHVPLIGHAILRFDDRADGRDRLVEALGDLAVGGLERTRARRRGVEFAGKPRAVGIEGMNLRGKCGVSPVALEPALTAPSSASSADCRRLVATSTIVASLT